jgi:ATP-dependent Lhr-like helicase
VNEWLHQKGLQPFEFQQQTWNFIYNNDSGIVNAPTGCGKTFSVFLGAVMQFINEHPTAYQKQKNNGLQLLWITPLRALATDIAKAMQTALKELNINWKVGVRNGDTNTAQRQKQKLQPPEILLITPESLHLLLAQKNYAHTFSHLKIIAVDEWHELLGSKRGVQVELAISRLMGMWKLNKLQTNKPPQVWGISATIGNLQEAKEILLYPLKIVYDNENFGQLVVAHLHKKIQVHSIIPEPIENYPWAGHLGLKLAHSLIPIIEESTTTLIFINTRGMAERWYQCLLDEAPHLAGAIAIHHGSIEKDIREWIENALHQQKLKAVICTASLDLGVDFRPVDTVVQVGSPKGVSRFLQRAGRSGHAPGEVSKIYFLPTHSLELIEAAALKTAIHLKEAESKPPLFLCFDVLLQYLCTLAVGDGFFSHEILFEIKNTYCFNEINEAEWQQVLNYITIGGKALEAYDEFRKVEVDEQGLYKIKSRKLAMRHRLHIGTIVSDAMLKVKLTNGKYIGVIEEYFISKLNVGDCFTLAGRNLELQSVKDITVIVKPSKSKKTIVPSWAGGRMSLTANLGKLLRETFDVANPKIKTKNLEVELQAIQPLLEIQQNVSAVPKSNEVLIEQIEAEDGFHLLVYPFEGRLIHEAMGAILAFRITQLQQNSFSISMNDYGFELYSDDPINLTENQLKNLFSLKDLYAHIQQSVNQVEMAKRKFRDIAVIGGLIFQGMPGEIKKARHLQSSASLLFNVFNEFDSDNILLRQSYTEVLEQQMEEQRLRAALERINASEFVFTYPKEFTPLSFPIVVDGLNRNSLSNEKLEDRIRKMQVLLQK